jgi:glycosyltransferase involved in cell wall biosynthesis
MARTPLHGQRPGHKGAATDRRRATVGTTAFSVQELISTEGAAALAPMTTERVGEPQPIANTCPRPLLDNGHAGANGHEKPVAVDQSELAAREVSEIADAPDQEEASASEITMAPLQPQRRLQGHIDTVDWASVNGWVWDPDTPGERIRLELVDGETALARTVASDHRPELVKRGVGDGGYGFSIEFPEEMLAEGPHTLHLRCADTGATVPGSPVILDYARRTEPINVMTDTATSPAPRTFPPAVPLAGTRMLFDISDLVYYIGHHANLTGIQRVQSSIVLSILRHGLVARSTLHFLSFNARVGRWVAIPTGFLFALLQDLFLPMAQRTITFPAEDARYGILPGAQEFTGAGVLDGGGTSVLCLLGAAWVQPDYLHRVLALKRRFGTRFVMTVHDLIPIYAPETCDQDTVVVFEEFMLRALRHADHILSVSENTANDVKRYSAALQLPEPPISVTKNGSSFTEFLPAVQSPGQIAVRELPERFVLFVATIEGRKNHQLILDLWRRMVDEGDDPPHLVCVGRLGWKSTGFISTVVESGYLGGRIHLLRDICDADLRLLYSRCLFTLCPSFYEGWGLPVGEALAMGKICVCSDRASLPEVAGEFGVYIDIDARDRSLAIIRRLLSDSAERGRLEAQIRRGYEPVTWHSVAKKVIAACQHAAGAVWQEPYPDTTIPYSSEISFGKLDRDVDGTGEAVLNRIVQTRRGLFLGGLLQEQNFLWGEEIRSHGSWAVPEGWGTWACHAGGDIVLALAPSDSILFDVFLRIRVSGLLTDHPISLSANGQPVWNGAIGQGSRNIHFRVQKQTLGTGSWRLRIRAELDLSAELRSQITALDTRVPTIGFERLVVVPENDLKTRVDILYSLFL